MNIFGLGVPELLIILFLLLLFFGKDKLPGLARSIGQSFKELRDSLVNGGNAEKEKGKGNPSAKK